MKDFTTIKACPICCSMMEEKEIKVGGNKKRKFLCCADCYYREAIENKTIKKIKNGREEYINRTKKAIHKPY